MKVFAHSSPPIISSKAMVPVSGVPLIGRFGAPGRGGYRTCPCCWAPCIRYIGIGPNNWTSLSVGRRGIVGILIPPLGTNAGCDLTSIPLTWKGKFPTVGDCSGLKLCGWLFSKVVIGWFGYAKGSAEGNIMALTSERGTFSPVGGSTNVLVKGVPGNEGTDRCGSRWGIPKPPKVGVEDAGGMLGTVAKNSEPGGGGAPPYGWPNPKFA